MLRIQSGSARGRIIKGLPKDYSIRPILARIRKSLFDILRFQLAGASFLDLFAGSGAVGLEALSNGAKSVIFVETNRKLCETLRENMEEFGFGNQAEVLQGDVAAPLNWLKRFGRFDIVFMGPPYKDAEKKPLTLTSQTLARLAEADLVSEKGVVVAQHHEKEPMETLPEGWEMFRQKEYGDSRLSFFQRK